MKRNIISIALLALSLAGSAKTAVNEGPFGWASAVSLTSGDAFTVTGGDASRTIILQSNGFDMRGDIIKSLKDYDVVVLDGSRGDFVVSSFMKFNGLSGKTLLGINGAKLRTQFSVTDELRGLLDGAGVKSMSDQGGGGKLSNGAYVAEEREQHTRQAIIDYTSDPSEGYRNAGLIGLDACENIIIRNIAFEGPGPIDVGGADLLTVSNGSKHIWVDHCSFTDGLDGNFDINSRSDFITVTWCVFQYTDKAYDHKASNLIASSENPDQGVDNLNVTYAYCIWGKGCEVRMPAVRWGTIHLLNNLYDCAGNYANAVYACIGAEVLMEGNYFEKGVKNIFEATDNAGGWQMRGNTFRERFKPSDKGVVNIPYRYSVLPSSRVPKLLRGPQGAGPTLDPEVPESSVKFTIHLMGDSTMADKDISRGNPERGWGMVLENFVDPSVRVINYAKNGRSTKSFIDEGLWDKVKANIRPGDYVFIEFAHNDEKSNKPAVYAAAWGAYQDNLRMFIKTARELGATPVLLTPVARRRFEKGVLDETTHGEYPAAMKAVSAETGTVLIDMEKATIDWIKAAGDKASRQYFMWVDPGTCAAMPDGRQDDTHSNARGARRNCDIVCDSIRVKIPQLAEHLVRYDFVVDKDGRGDFLTLQAAIDAVPDYLKNVQTTILLKPGVYRERIIIPASKCNLKIVGCGAENSVITFDNSARKLWPDMEHEIGTSGSASVFVNADDVTFEDLSIRNDAGQVGQAVALMTNGDRIMLRRCHIIGNQDTIYTYGRYGDDGQTCRSLYVDCLIEGTTDFIFGPGRCWLENCEIRSKRNSYVTAASTFEGEKYGYVFNRCRLTAIPGIDRAYLGRPWRDYAKVVYLNCEIGPHILPEGWHNWNNPSKEKTAFYAEYACYGPGADTSARVGWAHQLSDAEAAGYTLDNVMYNPGSGTWNPLENK